MVDPQLKPASATRLRPHPPVRYGLMGLPLAFAALPMYVHLPNVYANQYDTPLTTLGLVLLLTRCVDAVTDPWLGRWVDHHAARSHQRVLQLGAFAAVVMCLGLALTFFPPWSNPGEPWKLLAVLVPTSLAYSLLTIAHQSWGARLGHDEATRARVVAWREACGVIGVLLAATLPAIAGWTSWLITLCLSLVLAWIAWAHSPVPGGRPQHAQRGSVLQPWRHAAFRRLLAVYLLSGLAGAIPATLVLFFVQDRLGLPDLSPWFLTCYFVAAAASMPLWMRCVASIGLARTWLTSMVLAVLAFLGAASLDAGQSAAFFAVCALSGMASGADLALPSALLAGVIAQSATGLPPELRRESGKTPPSPYPTAPAPASIAGAYFGWWNFVSKLNLALAAGLALPLLGLWGYQPGTTHPTALTALTAAYAVLPCTLKLLAATVLFASLDALAPGRGATHRPNASTLQPPDAAFRSTSIAGGGAKKSEDCLRPQAEFRSSAPTPRSAEDRPAVRLDDDLTKAGVFAYFCRCRQK